MLSTQGQPFLSSVLSSTPYMCSPQASATGTDEDTGVRNLLLRLLKKDPKKRATIPQVLVSEEVEGQGCCERSLRHMAAVRHSSVRLPVPYY